MQPCRYNPTLDSKAALDPAYMGLRPVPAVRKILQAQNLKIDDFSAIELNEAFAVQSIACILKLKCTPETTNLVGSGISIGHPTGCTGARILVTLMHILRRQGKDLGLATYTRWMFGKYLLFHPSRTIP